MAHHAALHALSPASEGEADILDLAFGLTSTSRLGCQIIMSDVLDGLRIALPAEQVLENYRAV
jgi:ferredoxin